MKRTSLVSIIISALLIIGIVVYLARPRTDEVDNSQPHESVAPTRPVSGSGGLPSALASCVGPTDSQVPIANLAARHQWASSLLNTNHLNGALTELRSIATLDPGYPAINLDISDALLKSKHASDAKDAIKLQIEISECLSTLPQPDMLAYCKAEWVSAPQGGCIPELERIDQKAHYQAGVIDNELARTAEPRPEPAVPVSAPARAVARPTVSPAASTAAVVPTSAPKSTADEVATAPAVAAAVVSAVPPPPPIKIKTTEASEHVGQVATVCGPVIGKHTAEESNGKPTFVNFDHPFPNPGFTAVIWGTDGPAVGDFPETGNVCVTGTIATYRGSPEIVVHDAKSWYQADRQ
jgi:hypothetical protein